MLLVSEERSEISLSYEGELIRESEENIKQILFKLLLGRASQVFDSDITKRTGSNADGVLVTPLLPQETAEASTERLAPTTEARYEATKKVGASSVESTL